MLLFSIVVVVIVVMKDDAVGRFPCYSKMEVGRQEHLSEWKWNGWWVVDHHQLLPKVKEQ